MPKLPDFDPIDFLVKKKFPPSAKQIARTISNASTHNLQKQSLVDFSEDALREEQKKTYRKELLLKTKEEIQILVSEEYEKEAELISKRTDKVESERFFNQESANADFDYWSKAHYWTLDEAVALSFGKNPKLVNWESVQHYVGISYESWRNRPKSMAYPSRFADEYDKLRELANRAKTFGALFNPILPSLFIGWAKKNDIPFPKELEELVQKRSVAIMDWQSIYEKAKEQHQEEIAIHKNYEDQLNSSIESWKNNSAAKDKLIEALKKKIVILEEASARKSPETAEEKPLHKKERESLRKMFVGMAACFYKPERLKNETIKANDISGDLVQLGISISDDTIRPHLKESLQYLSEALDEEKYT